QNAQALAPATRRDLGGRHLVRPVHLDGAKAGARRGIDPLEQRTIRPQQPDVGGEPGHGTDQVPASGSSRAWWTSAGNFSPRSVGPGSNCSISTMTRRASGSI